MALVDDRLQGVPSVRDRWLFGRYDYPVSHRVVELVVLVVFAVFAAPWSLSTVRELVGRLGPGSAPWVVLVVLAAYATADLLSGAVHNLLDNHGSPDMPIFGAKFVKPFRDHHIDPLEMTRGDWIAVNADNVLAALPVVVVAASVLEEEAHPYVALFLLTLVTGVIFTNQIHKWTHVAHPPTVVRFLQRHHVILSPEHHAVHHRPPYAANYSITWGAADVLLNRVVGAGREHRAGVSGSRPRW